MQDRSQTASVSSFSEALNQALARRSRETLEAEEDAIALTELSVAAQELALCAELAGVDGRRAALRRRLRALAEQGVPGVDKLLQHLPHVVPSLLSAEQRRADALRQAAVEARRRAIEAREEAIAFTQSAATRGIAAMAQIEAEMSALPPVPPVTPRPATHTSTREAITTGNIRRLRLGDRFKLDARVDLGTPTNFYLGRVRNISPTGLFIATFDQLPEGSEVDLAFELPSGLKVRTTGVVRWARAADPKAPAAWPGLGVAFGELTAEARCAIETFTRQRVPMSGPRP